MKFVCELKRLSRVWNAILKPLEFVVDGAAHIFVGIFDDRHHEVCSLALGYPWGEAVPKSFDCWFAFETWEVGS